MINLNGSRFTSIMPDNLAAQVEIQAIAYAVGKQIEKLCTYADSTRTYAAIATMPERVLDLLAVELRTPAYSERYPVETKRELVKNALTFYTKMGTPSAVDKIIETIFGSGEIREWFDYDGDPYHFRVTSTNINQVSANCADFVRALESVKRKSAWLDSITAIAKTHSDALYAGFAMQVGKSLSVNCQTTDVSEIDLYGDENGGALADGVGGLLEEE